MFYPELVTPAFNQGGQSSRRTAGVAYNPGNDAGFANFNPVPKTLGAASSITSDAFLAVGYNAFMFNATSSAQNVQVDINHLDPFNPGTILFVRPSVGVLTAGGSALVVWGYGSAAAACGFDVFHTFSITLRNATGVSTNITALGGLWCTAR